jgi:hypothetical protein
MLFANDAHIIMNQSVECGNDHNEVESNSYGKREYEKIKKQSLSEFYRR